MTVTSASVSAPSSSAAPDPHLPVVSDLDLLRRVREFVPVAVRRQLWTLFLDADDVQLPMVVPLEGIPHWPDRLVAERWGDALAAVSAEFGAVAVVFVLERPGASADTPSDVAWREVLTGLAGTRCYAVRAVFTCATDGVVALPGARKESTRDASRGQSSPRRLRLSEELTVR